jgi:hypothetical protein
VKSGPALLAAYVAVALALTVGAPWPGQSERFAAFAVAAGALALAVGIGGRTLPARRSGLALILAVAALVRLPLLFTPPTLSDDVHRYVVDGHLWMHGHDAYTTTPLALRAAGGFRDAAADTALARVNHPQLATIYPPFAEVTWTALAAAGLGERGFRAFFALCDLVTVAALARILLRRGRSPWPAALFAFHPLAILESAGSGHSEALACALLAIAWERSEAGKRGFSALAWIAAAGVKPLALVAMPFLAPRWGGPRTIFAVALTATQYALLSWASGRGGEASGLYAYVATWQHNDLLFESALGLGLAPGLARVVYLAVGVAIALVLLARKAPPIEGYAWVTAWALLASPVLHPWYALALLVAVPVLERRGPRATGFALALAVLATYVVPTAAGDTPGFRVLPVSTRLFELTPILIVVIVEAAAALRARAAGRGRPPAKEDKTWSGKPSAMGS